MTESPEVPETPAPRVEIRGDSRKRRILDDSLVLSSQRVRHWLEFDGERFLLTVEPEHAERAREVLGIYERENAGFHAGVDDSAPLGLHLSPLLHLALPAAVFFWAASVPWEPWLTNRGGAAAGKVVAGEWWRTVTATTLHADTEHFLGNMLSGFFILNLLRRRAGPGTSMLLLTLAAALTNFVAAAFSVPERFSLGFSTVVFAALGMLAGAETLALANTAAPRRGLRSLTPLLAAFFLAVMTGLGENADIKAHFIGFAFGALLSPALPWLARRGFGRWYWQLLGVAATLSLYTAAWWRALR